MPKSTPAWREFEKLIQDVFSKNPKAVVHPDAVVKGRSGRRRKMELLVEYPFEIPFADEFAARVKIKIAVDCKNYKKSVGLKKVEEFAGQMDDIGAPVGIMLAPNGFDKGANERARQLNIFLIHATWDLLLLAKGLGVDPPEFHLCQECAQTAEERDRLGVVDWRIPQTRNAPAWGGCGFCGALHAICPDCFEITGFADGDEGNVIECAGCCDRVYEVSFDPREGEHEMWTLSGIERRILTTIMRAGGAMNTLSISGIVGKSKWRLAADHSEAPVPRLLRDGLIEHDAKRGLTRLTDYGRETVEDRLSTARSGHYGW